MQIRTQQMHDDAELGVAAHWKYKEGNTGSMSAYEEKIAWLRKLLAWQDDITDSGEVMAELRSKCLMTACMCLLQRAKWWICQRDQRR